MITFALSTGRIGIYRRLRALEKRCCMRGALLLRVRSQVTQNLAKIIVSLKVIDGEYCSTAVLPLLLKAWGAHCAVGNAVLYPQAKLAKVG